MAPSAGLNARCGRFTRSERKPGQLPSVSLMLFPVSLPGGSGVIPSSEEQEYTQTGQTGHTHTSILHNNTHTTTHLRPHNKNIWLGKPSKIPLEGNCRANFFHMPWNRSWKSIQQLLMHRHRLFRRGAHIHLENPSKSTSFSSRRSSSAFILLPFILC